jgi:hypothetical protein
VKETTFDCYRGCCGAFFVVVVWGLCVFVVLTVRENEKGKGKEEEEGEG